MTTKETWSYHEGTHIGMCIHHGSISFENGYCVHRNKHGQITKKEPMVQYGVLK